MDHFMYFIEQNFLNMFHSGIWIVHNNVCYYPPFPIKKKNVPSMEAIIGISRPIRNYNY